MVCFEYLKMNKDGAKPMVLDVSISLTRPLASAIRVQGVVWLRPAPRAWRRLRRRDQSPSWAVMVLPLAVADQQPRLSLLARLAR